MNNSWRYLCVCLVILKYRLINEQQLAVPVCLSCYIKVQVN